MSAEAENNAVSAADDTPKSKPAEPGHSTAAAKGGMFSKMKKDIVAEPARDAATDNAAAGGPDTRNAPPAANSTSATPNTSAKPAATTGAAKSGGMFSKMKESTSVQQKQATAVASQPVDKPSVDKSDGTDGAKQAGAGMFSAFRRKITAPRDADGDSSSGVNNADAHDSGLTAEAVARQTESLKTYAAELRAAEEKEAATADKLKKLHKRFGTMEKQLEAHQDKSLQRESEMREAAKLDKQAKAHLAGSFKSQLEERDDRIQVMSSQIEALKVMAAAPPSGGGHGDELGRVREDLIQKDEELARKTQMLQKCKERIKKLSSEKGGVAPGESSGPGTGDGEAHDALTAQLAEKAAMLATLEAKYAKLSATAKLIATKHKELKAQVQASEGDTSQTDAAAAKFAELKHRSEPIAGFVAVHFGQGVGE